MPDAATHILLQTIFNNLLGLKKLFPYALLGAIIPDLTKGIIRYVHPDIAWFFYPSHSPIYVLIFFYVISLLFVESERIYLIGGGMFGMMIHLMFDVFQINLDGGHYMPFFPLSFYSFSLNIIKTESSLFFLPITTLITLIVIKLKKD